MMKQEFVTRLEHAALVAIDLETTGLSPVKHQIVEIGAVKYEGEKCTYFNELIRQKEPLPAFITELTHITDSMVGNAKDLDTVMLEFDAFLGKKDFVLIAHNARFDFSFLQVNAMRMKKQNMVMENWCRDHIWAIDTLALSKKLRGDLPKHNLASMLAAYGLVNNEAHRAMADAKACYELYRCMKQKMYADHPEVFCPKQMAYKEKKTSAATAKQKKDLQELIKYHKIVLSVLEEEEEFTWDTLTKSQASRLLEKLRSFGKNGHHRS